MIKYGIFIVLCAYAARCQVKMPPCTCPRNFAPVCGNDGNTYPNECVLRCEQSKNEELQLQHTGECTKENPEQFCACTFIYKPVCGSDGKTYSNECSLNCAKKQNPNLKLSSEGMCPNLETQRSCICTLIYQPVCGSDGKTYPNPCKLNCESKENPSLKLKYQGECQKENIKPKPCVCPRLLSPVCVSGGRTYANECGLKCDMALNPNLSLAHRGPCEKNIVRRHVPCMCQRMYAPVCGDNGKTYANDCLLKCDAQESGRNIQTSHTGRCEDSELAVGS